MRGELRTEIVKALHVAATRLPDLPDLSADLDRLALEVGTELEEGDEVECPTSKYNEQFLAEEGPQCGDLVEWLRPGLATRKAEVVGTGPGVSVAIYWDGSDGQPEINSPLVVMPSELAILDTSGRARTMHVAYVSWLDDVVVVTDDDGCNAEIVTHAQCTRVARS